MYLQSLIRNALRRPVQNGKPTKRMRGRRLRCESLESRRVLSANTVAELVDGQLMVTGDNAANSIVIQRQDFDDIVEPTTLPHISIEGTGDGTFDYFSFSVEEAGTRGIFDIDDENFDSSLFIFDEAGNQVAYNDDFGGFFSGPDPGSDSAFSSLLQYTFPSPGNYTLGIGKWYSYSEAGEVVGTPLDFGYEYTLHISLEGKSLNHGAPNLVEELGGNDTRSLAQNVDDAGWSLDGTPANIIVEALGSDHTVNGSDAAIFPAADITDVHVRLKAGDDQVELFQMLVPGDISIDTGPDQDQVILLATQSSGDMTIETREGDDRVRAFYVETGGDLSIATRQGDDLVQLWQELSVDGQLSVSTGEGDDFVGIAWNDVTFAFGNDVSFDMGQGNDTLRMEFVASEVGFGGDLDISLGNGDDRLSIFGFTFPGFPGLLATGTGHVAGDVRIDAGNGDDGIEIDALNVMGDLDLRTGPGDDFALNGVDMIGERVTVAGTLNRS